MHHSADPKALFPESIGTETTGTGSLSSVSRSGHGVGSHEIAPHLTVSRQRQSSRPGQSSGAGAGQSSSDLGRPLGWVQESIRRVHRGDLGQVNAEQAEILSAAIQQCERIEQIVGQMTQLERQRSGASRADRQWLKLAEIRGSLEQTLRSWASPRHVDVLWDDDIQVGGVAVPAVYADSSMLKQLLFRLVADAVQASDQGQEVLVRFSAAPSGELVRCSVIDQGQGIDRDTLDQMRQGNHPVGGRPGRDLAICSHLAAAHFTLLNIQSQLGIGTEVSFELPASGPRSVGSAFATFRQQVQPQSDGQFKRPLVRPRRIDSMADPTTQQPVANSPDAAIRMDLPSIRKDSVRQDTSGVRLAYQGARPKYAGVVAAGVVNLGATVPRQTADRFDAVLQNHLDVFEFSYRVNARRWVWGLDADEAAINERIEAIGHPARSLISGLRCNWSTPQIIRIEPRTTATRLNDLIVRHSLSAFAVDHGLGPDEVRLGTGPIVQSDSAALRLDEELGRLSQSMRMQTKRLKQQSKKLRPKD